MGQIDWQGAAEFFERMSESMGGRLTMTVTALLLLTPFLHWGLPAIGDFIVKVIGALRK